MLRMKCWLAKPGGTQGQALIETALTIPFLMLIVVGGLELGRLAYAAIEVSNAASAAVQYGAQTASTAADCNSAGSGTCTSAYGIYTAAKADAADLEGLTVTSARAVICADGTVPSDSTTGPPWSNTDCSTSAIETLLTVNVSASVNTWFHFPGLPSTFTLYGRDSQVVVGN